MVASYVEWFKFFSPNEGKSIHVAYLYLLTNSICFAFACISFDFSKPTIKFAASHVNAYTGPWKGCLGNWRRSSPK